MSEVTHVSEVTPIYLTYCQFLVVFLSSCRIFGSSSSIFDFTPQHAGVKQSRGKKRFEPYRRTAGNLTWTHKFVCLAESDQEDLPSAAEKYKLKCNDLGEKKVVFNLNGNWSHIKETVLRLRDTGPL